ncbi:MAG TPA: AtpZ/AtpI family protein [Candidatus Polarisedimenticolia bacterium]|nr:AtpZ/AtpI family protein [Candidatus Polarisedimenticolia bacterium]
MSPGPVDDVRKYGQIGTMLIAPMVAFGAIGWWLDRRFGTKPWWMLAGLILGMIGGFVNFFRLVLPPKDHGPGRGKGAP